jgi:type IV secretion system protein VirB10
MELIDKLKDRLRQNFGGKKPAEAGVSAAPSGMQLRPDVESGVAGLSKNLIVAVAGVLALAIFGIWYGLTHVKPTMEVNTGRAATALASANNIAAPRAYAPPKPAAVASAASAPATAPASRPAPEAGHTAAQTQPSVQQQALAQALSGNGQSGGGWSSSAQGKSDAHPAQTAPNSDQLYSDIRQRAGANDLGAPTPTAINPVNGQSGLGVYNTHLVRKPASPYELMQGGVIPATLTTGIESDLPGQITAVVSRNVFDSASGAHLLIPAGAQLVGTYSSKVLPGQASVAVAWTRVIFPNGSYINLGTMPGTDPNGMSGISGEVDNHTWLMFKNALLLSLVGTGMQAGLPQSTSTNGSLSTAQIFQSQLVSTFGQAVSQSLQRYMNISPTIYVQPGAQVAVVVSKDLVFPGSYTPAMQAAPQAPRDAAIPAMINPYPQAEGKAAE